MFQIKDRGFIREGYWADLAIVNLNLPWTVGQDNITSKCRWSPFEGQQFNSAVTHTLVNGHVAYISNAGPESSLTFDESVKGQRLSFDR